MSSGAASGSSKSPRWFSPVIGKKKGTQPSQLSPGKLSAGGADISADGAAEAVAPAADAGSAERVSDPVARDSSIESVQALPLNAAQSAPRCNISELCAYR